MGLYDARASRAHIFDVISKIPQKTFSQVGGGGFRTLLAVSPAFTRRNHILFEISGGGGVGGGYRYEAIPDHPHITACHDALVPGKRPCSYVDKKRGVPCDHGTEKICERIL